MTRLAETRRAILTVLATLTLLAGLCAGHIAHAETVTIICGDGGGFDFCPTAAQQWAEKTGNTVDVVTLPNETTVKLSLLQQLLGARASDIDVMMVDITWPGLLANHFADLNRYLPAGTTDGFFDSLIRNNTIDGRLVAMPWFTDAGLLYYRKDLLARYDRAVPETWAELQETAAYIQQQQRAAGNARFYGYVFQGRAYEGLACNALEWVASFGGGSLVAPDGRVTIDNPEAAAALDTAATWVGSIAPKGVLNYTEEEARGVFQTGNALFMRNWPYAWSLAQGKESQIRDKVAIAPLPHAPGHDSQATLGGWNFALSRYSRHKQLGADLIAYLTSAEVQRQHALTMGMNPTRRALYDEPAIVGQNPAMKAMRYTLEHAVLRPASITGAAYPRISNIFFNQTHEVLAGKQSGADAVAAMARKYEYLSRRGW